MADEVANQMTFILSVFADIIFMTSIAHHFRRVMGMTGAGKTTVSSLYRQLECSSRQT